MLCDGVARIHGDLEDGVGFLEAALARGGVRSGVVEVGGRLLMG